MKIKNLTSRNILSYHFFEKGKTFEIDGEYKIYSNDSSEITINLIINNMCDEENTTSIKLSIDSDENIHKTIKKMNKLLNNINIDVKLPNPPKE